MSLPGLGLSAPTELEVEASTIHQLGPGAEWRFEVAFGSNVNVKVAREYHISRSRI